MPLPPLWSLEVTLDTSIHIGEIFALLGGARWILTGGLALRDGIRDLKGVVDKIQEDVDDHEDRLRAHEGMPPLPQRRRTDRRRPSVVPT
jgi:hypothetical protein